MSGMSLAEHSIMQAVLPRLEAEGFRVFLSPSRSMLPTFLGPVPPDAVACKGERKVAIEVAASRDDAGAKVRELQGLLASHPDWELRLIYAPPRQEEVPVPVLPRATIEEHLNDFAKMSAGVPPSARLLMAWAIFEAASRSVVANLLPYANSTEALLEAIASEGIVTPDEADELIPAHVETDPSEAKARPSFLKKRNKKLFSLRLLRHFSPAFTHAGLHQRTGKSFLVLFFKKGLLAFYESDSRRAGMRRIVRVRNRIVHGALDFEAGQADIESVLGTARDILDIASA